MASFGFASNLSAARRQQYGVVRSRSVSATKHLILPSPLYFRRKQRWNIPNVERRSIESGFACAYSELTTTVLVDIDKVEEKKDGRALRVGLICGGPSAERGISLNSARSVLDHIEVSLLQPLAFIYHMSVCIVEILASNLISTSIMLTSDATAWYVQIDLTLLL